ncbi:ADP-ribose pyrophosphatase [Pelotomaculum thermopropionicum SI]|uniref:ADP-ribose pyrophosphatase n=1 Tax=Pelotomaculum thermopropionicum (strain DSM 13744 / JCM 10971 / SI) TaxID=370438 RepID=A5CYT5_PELTS|nr:ADP-ribose pyrophosphatase [Pelotomaculum thermopropionicum SI]
MKQRFFYCPKCGGRLEYRRRGERERLTCTACGYVFYENPVVGVAVIVFDGSGRILLGRRSGSYRGLWCIPCGYVEYDEDVFDAAVREFKEETGLEVIIKKVFTVQSNFHNPETHTVGIWFLADVTGGELKAQGDLDEVGYFDLSAPPPLAFPTDALVIEMLKSRKPRSS